MATDAALNHLAEAVLSGFSTINVLIFLSLHLSLWKEVNMCCPHLMSRESCYTSSNLCNLFGILPHWRFFTSPSFINLSNPLFISVLISRYLFHTFSHNPILLYFAAQIVSAYSSVKCFNFFIKCTYECISGSLNSFLYPQL